MAEIIDLTGRRFGRLVVIERAKKNKSGHRRWLCRCDCGVEKVVTCSNIRRGDTTSCGCRHKENNSQRAVRHGHTNATGLEGRTYRIWRNMLSRCINSKHPSWRYYGGLGVKVCPRWNPQEGGSYEKFLSDMGVCPSEKHTIDKDKKGNGMLYSKDNCCWLTVSEQCRYKRNNVYVVYNDQRMILKDAAKAAGVAYNTVRKRISQGRPESDWFLPRGV